MAENTIKTRFRIRRDTESNFENFTLAQGEPSYATDTGVFKIGDGSTTWQNLPTITLTFIGDEEISYDSTTGITAYITKIEFEEEDSPITITKASGKYKDTIPVYEMNVNNETLALDKTEEEKDLIDLTIEGTYKRLKSITNPNITIEDHGHTHKYKPTGSIK